MHLSHPLAHLSCEMFSALGNKTTYKRELTSELCKLWQYKMESRMLGVGLILQRTGSAQSKVPVSVRDLGCLVTIERVLSETNIQAPILIQFPKKLPLVKEKLPEKEFLRLEI